MAPSATQNLLFQTLRSKIQLDLDKSGFLTEANTMRNWYNFGRESGTQASDSHCREHFGGAKARSMGWTAITYRFNNRKAADLVGMTVARMARISGMTYSAQVAESAPSYLLFVLNRE